MSIFKRTMEALRKSKDELDAASGDQGDATAEGSEELTEDQKLEKAFDAKMAALTDQGEGAGDTGTAEGEGEGADDGGNQAPEADPLAKAKKDKDKKDDDDDDDDDMGSGAEGQQSLFKKSFDDEASAETVEVMNVEPFLKSLVTALDKQFTALAKSIKGNAKSVAEVQEVQARMTEFMVSQGQLVKSNFQRLTAIGGQPVPRQARLAVRNRFQDNASESMAKSATEYDPTQVRQAMREAGTKGLLKSFQIAKCESRMSKGLPIPEDVLGVLGKLEKAKANEQE